MKSIRKLFLVFSVFALFIHANAEIRKISFMLYPIIPDSIEKALKIFNLKPNAIDFESIGKHDFLKSGDMINKIDILFKKIEKKDD